MPRTLKTLTAVLAAAIGLAGCTVHKQDEAPPLTGPSETGLSLQITVSPDVLTQDGQSQSLVAVQTYGPNGQVQRSVPLRAEIVVGGASTDFGSLSARNIVTDGNGRATVTYTAPPSPVFSTDNGTTVQIMLTPVGTDYANSVPKTVSIRLVPPGNVGPPPSNLRPDFVLPSVTVGNPGVFTATVVDASGADATGQVMGYIWNFGDGDTALGRSVTHVYDDPGSYQVSLTITDTLGRTQTTIKSITVGQGQLPVANFIYSPQSPIINQTINFNAAGSTAEPGHVVTRYFWTFGDGTESSEAAPRKAYSQNGVYVVTLMVSDDAGRDSLLKTENITVGLGNPTADFTFNPSAPRSGQQVTFNASASQAAPGRTIVSYSWSFDDGTPDGNGQIVTHTFTLPPPGLTAKTYNILLTVTDSAGRTASVTKPLTVNP